MFGLFCVYTARCYAERGIAAASHLSVTLRYRDHIGWNTSKVISWLIGVGRSLSAHSNITDLLQGNHPEIPGGTGAGQTTCDIMLLLIYSFTFISAFMQRM